MNFDFRNLSFEVIYRIIWKMIKCNNSTYTFILTNNLYKNKTNNIGNFINNRCVKRLTNNIQNKQFIYVYDRVYPYNDKCVYKYLKYISNVCFISEYCSENYLFIKGLKSYKCFLSGYNPDLDYKNCTLKCFRFQEFEGKIMPDITVVMWRELKTFANGFDKNITIDYDTNKTFIDGIESIDTKPWLEEKPENKLLLLGSAKYLKSNSLHCILLGLMIGIPICEITFRKNTYKMDQMKNWLEKIGFKIDENKIYNYDHDWSQEEKIVYEMFNKYILCKEQF